MEHERTPNSLRDFLTVIFKHRSRISAVFIATVATVAVGSFLMPPTFEAKSSLMVKFGREYVYRSEVGETSQAISFSREETVNSEIEILKSRDLIEKVITSLGVEKIYPSLANNPQGEISPLDAAILKFEKKLSVESIKKSNVIQVTFQHRDARVAASAVKRLVELFKEKHLQVFSDTKATFMEQQLAIYRDKLDESEKSLEAFKREHGVFSIDEQRRLLLQQRVDLDTTLKDAENRAVELTQKISTLKDQMRTVSESIHIYQDKERYEIIDDAKAQLLALQLREQDLLSKHKENNRLVVNVRKDIALVKDFLKEQEKEVTSKVRTGKNAVYQQLEMEMIQTEAGLKSLQARIGAIKEQIALLDQKMQNLELRENELRNLSRERKINEANYQTYVQKMEEARITDDMNRQKMVNISVIQEAAVPAKPVKPRKRLNILLAIILGSVSGLGLAFSSEYVSQGLVTPESAEDRLHLPVIATVPYRDDLEEAPEAKKRGKGKIFRVRPTSSKEH